MINRIPCAKLKIKIWCWFKPPIQHDLVKVNLTSIYFGFLQIFASFLNVFPYYSEKIWSSTLCNLHFQTYERIYFLHPPSTSFLLGSFCSRLIPPSVPLGILKVLPNSTFKCSTGCFPMVYKQSSFYFSIKTNSKQ